MTNHPCGAHLVGSIPLANTHAALDTAARVLGKHVRRLPDGETGERSNWIRWQEKVFANVEALEVTYSDPFRSVFGLKSDRSIDQLELPPLGYADAALDSFSIFSTMQQEGRVADGMRFQVALPTPLAPVQFYIDATIQSDFEPLYEKKLLEELSIIADSIPHDRLAVQWDTAVEFGVLEGTFPAFFGDKTSAILARLIRLGNAVPDTIELGFHLCYGDSGHKHFVEPRDTTLLVNVANGIAGGIDRALNWLHLPVPRDRSDDEYFKPLSDLALNENTELYLGLIHMTDGAAGARRRIETAKRFVSKFGVATECGFGRRPGETVEELMQMHADLADPIT